MSNPLLAPLSLLQSHLALQPGPVISDTTLMTSVLAAVSDSTRNWCNRYFNSDFLTGEVHDGDGLNELILDEFPITDMSSLSFINWDGTTTDWDLTNDVLRTDRDDKSGRIRLNPRSMTSPSRVFPQGTANIVASYTGGFTVIPDEVQQGVVLWAAEVLLSLRHDFSLAGETLSKYTWRGKQTAPMMASGVKVEPPESARMFLSNYRTYL